MTTTNQPPNPPRRNLFTSKPFLILAATVVLLCGGLLVFKLLKDNTTLSFNFLLDGKPLSVGVAPKVQVDGQPFTSGLTITPGSHKLTAELQNAESFERQVRVFYGDKNLGALPLESSKGSLLVSVNLSPASVIVRRGTETIGNGDAPLALEKLPFGNYELEIKRGEHKETHSIKIQGKPRTEAKIELNLGGVSLSSDPADAEFSLSGNGMHWQGKLPLSIDNVPVGNYSLITRRKGLEIKTGLVVSRGGIVTNKTEFQYGSISVTSEPTGWEVSANGIAAGKTPTVLHELKPGQYSLTATDGENNLTAELTVGPKEEAKHAFVFHFGAAQIVSTPAGATVLRKGKEIGKTPLTLSRLPVGEAELTLNIAGYVSTNVTLLVAERATANVNVKLISERYLEAMKQAREAFDAGQYTETRNFITNALVIEPNDPTAIKVLADVVEKEREIVIKQMEIERKGKQALLEAGEEYAKMDFAKAAQLAKDALKLLPKNEQAKMLLEQCEMLKSVPVLDYQKLLNDCVVIITKNPDGSDRIIPDFQTRQDVFQQKYFGKKVLHRGKVAKVDKSGMITLKDGGVGSPEVLLYLGKDNLQGLGETVQKGKEIIVTGTISKLQGPSVLLVLINPAKLTLVNVTLIEARAGTMPPQESPKPVENVTVPATLFQPNGFSGTYATDKLRIVFTQNPSDPGRIEAVVHVTNMPWRYSGTFENGSLKMVNEKSTIQWILTFSPDGKELRGESTRIPPTGASFPILIKLKP